MSLCPPFHCSRCKVSHAGECPPAAVAAPAIAGIAGPHDWEELPVYDLSVRSVCKRCSVTHRKTVLDHHMGRNERPVDGCPGKPPN